MTPLRLNTPARNAPSKRLDRPVPIDAGRAAHPGGAGSRLASRVALLALGTSLCAPAHAYIGPGAGLGVIGTLFGIGAAILLAMFGLLWYPLKRAFGKKGADEVAPIAETPPAAVTDATNALAPAGSASADGERHDASEPRP